MFIFILPIVCLLEHFLFERGLKWELYMADIKALVSEIIVGIEFFLIDHSRLCQLSPKKLIAYDTINMPAVCDCSTFLLVAHESFHEVFLIDSYMSKYIIHTCQTRRNLVVRAY